MNIIEFQVQGSKNEPYIVTFKNNDGVISASCTCPAAIYGQYCKHRIDILLGSEKGIVSGNASDIAAVLSWLPGSNVEGALESVATAELELKSAQEAVKKAKKSLARTLISR